MAVVEKEDTVVGAVLGALIGMGLSKGERDIGPVGHTLIAAVIGGTLGSLLLGKLVEKRNVVSSWQPVE